MSRKFVVMADPTCDLNQDIRDEYGIEVIPGHYSLPDKTEVISDLTWGDVDRVEFYNNLRKNPLAYKTAPPNAYEFSSAFDVWAQKGCDIMVLTISSAMSGTFGFARAGAESTAEKYPDVRIRCIDTLRFGPAIGLLAIMAAQLRDQGLDVDDAAEKVNGMRFNIHQAGWLDDLSFVARAKRMNNAKAFFGTIAGIKPIGDLDPNGMTTIIGKAKGEKSGYELCLRYMEKTIVDPQDHILIVAHTNREKQALEFRDLIEQRIKPGKLLMTTVFPSCGINIGPGLMAAYYYGKPVSQNLEEEKKLFAELSAK
ncbi:MAG: DegV family protein [Spirochaetales bacterium]|nr:DegV family protein [Spirochaetales bacterium]